MSEIELIGEKIKELRKGRQLTLKDISEKTSLSVSFLSQVERGLSSMTLVSLRKIADALEVPMNELVTVDERSTYINQTESQVRLRLGQYKHFVRLSGKFTGRRLEGILVVMEPYQENREESIHEGEEFYYVVKGRASFILEEEEHCVSEGECIHFPSHIRHKIINRGDVELQMICVVTPPIF